MEHECLTAADLAIILDTLNVSLCVANGSKFFWIY